MTCLLCVGYALGGRAHHAAAARGRAHAGAVPAAAAAQRRAAYPGHGAAAHAPGGEAPPVYLQVEVARSRQACAKLLTAPCIVGGPGMPCPAGHSGGAMTSLCASVLGMSARHC